MGNPKAFLTIHRKEAGYRPVSDRIRDYGEVEQTLNPEDRRLQASRCMECGVPFCHWSCPLGNKQPEWLPTTFLNLQDEFVLHYARRVVCLTRYMNPSPYAKTKPPL